MKFLRSNPVNVAYAYFDLKNATIHILDGYGTANGGPISYLVNLAGTNDVQTITNTDSGGTFTIAFRSSVTTAIPFAATGATIQTAMRLLSTINGANVTVTGSANGPYTVTFIGVLAGELQPLLVIDNTSGTGGSVTVVHTTPGVPAYAAGITTMAVDTTMTGPVAPVSGDTFKVANLDPNVQDTTVYTLTGTPTTTSWTFTPALVLAVQDDAVITVQPHDLNVKLGDGNFTFTEKKPREYKKNRGKLDSVRNGDEDPLEVKLDFAWIFISSSSGEPVTVEEALKKIGGASNWVTAGVDPCEPYCVTMRINYIPPCTNVKSEIIDLAEFRYEELQHDTKTGMIACTGKCNLTSPTVTRV